jgi:hypothetical protein
MKKAVLDELTAALHNVKWDIVAFREEMRLAGRAGAEYDRPTGNVWLKISPWPYKFEAFHSTPCEE